MSRNEWCHIIAWVLSTLAIALVGICLRFYVISEGETTKAFVIAWVLGIGLSAIVVFAIHEAVNEIGGIRWKD